MTEVARLWERACDLGRASEQLARSTRTVGCFRLPPPFLGFSPVLTYSRVFYLLAIETKRLVELRGLVPVVEHGSSYLHVSRALQTRGDLRAR